MRSGRSCASPACHRALTPLLIALATVSPLSAQRPFPYRLHPVRETVLLAGGAALLAGSFAMNSTVHPLTPEEIAALDPDDINGFDRPATRRWSATAADLSDGVLLATVALPFTTIAVARGESAPVTVAVMLGETILVGNGITQLTKTSAERIRPFVYNDDPAIPSDEKTRKNAKHSFPSGHTMNAFAAAVFTGTVFGKLRPTSPARPWVWVGSLTVATTVGYLRYEAGKHFPTDILTGAVVGAGIGWAIPKLHESDRVDVSVAPSPWGTVMGLSFRF